MTKLRKPSLAPPQGPLCNLIGSGWTPFPPGTFTMGSPASEPARYSDEGPQTQVTISRGFWMGKYEVTQGEYLAVMGSNPSYFRTADYSGGTGGTYSELRHPVER